MNAIERAVLSLSKDPVMTAVQGPVLSSVERAVLGIVEESKVEGPALPVVEDPVNSPDR
jgi:hypothetical protein